jgi:hypothetical protein
MNVARGAALALIAVCLAGAWFGWHTGRARAPAATIHPPDVSAPAAERIRLEVMNSTRVRGLARQATAILRDAGFDVVIVGTSTEQRDSTVVLDRSHHPEWARRAAAALGGARIESRPDSTRYVDISVLLGGAWRPPAQPLHP